MQNWPQAGTGRSTESESAAAADQDRTGPDRPESPAAPDDSSEWDELAPMGTGQLTPPADVLVAGAPLTEQSGSEQGGGESGGSEPAGGEQGGGEQGGSPPAEDAETGGGPADRPGSATARPESGTGAVAEVTRAHGGGESILDPRSADEFQARWRDVQFGFVDDPGASVQQAGELADEVLSAFTEALTARRGELAERRRGAGAVPPDTEQLRLIVRAYREFVDRLLTT